MKKSILFVTAALSFGVAGAQGTVATTVAQAPALTDVPAGHWAKDAVERLVSQGIILGYPDGTYRGTQTLTRYEAAMIINRLLDRIGAGDLALGDLSDETLASLRNAINELSAQGANFEGRLAELEANAVSKEDFARLEGRVDAIATTGTNAGVADQLATVNEMATLLNQDVLELQDRVDGIDGELATFDERLGAVETQTADNTAAINAQGLRLGNLENGRVKMTLGLSGGYGNVALVRGSQNFDVDRVTEGTFAKEVYTAQADDAAAATRVRKNDTQEGAKFSGGVTLGLKAENVNIDDKVVVEEAGVDFGLSPAALVNSTVLAPKGDKATTDAAVVTLAGAEATGRIGDDARFRAVAKAGTTAVPLRPDVVNPVGKLEDKVDYNTYLMPSGAENGVAAGVSLSDVPFKPTLYLNAGYGTGVDDGLPNAPYFGARTEMKLGKNADAGLNYQRFGSPSGNDGETYLGIDASYNQPKANNEGTLWGVKALYNAEIKDNTGTDFGSRFTAREQAARLDGQVNLFNVGLKGDFRAVTPKYNSRDIEGDDIPYLDRVGYGASASTKLGKMEVGAYGDTYTNYYDGDWANRRAGFGGHVGTNLNAFRVVGFASRASDQSLEVTAATDLNKARSQSSYIADAPGDPTVRYVETSDNASEAVQTVPAINSDRSKTIFAPAKATQLYRYTTGVGGLVTHDGTAANALVPNLDLAAAGIYNYADGDTYVAGYAGYNSKVGGMTVTPFLGAAMYNQTEANRVAAADNTKVQGGLNIASPVYAGKFKPQFKAGVGAAYYTTGANENNVAATGNEWGGTAEVTLNEFFSPATKLSLGYGYRQVNGLDDNRRDNNGNIAGNLKTFNFGGRYAKPVAQPTGNYTQTQGVFTQLAWNDVLKFNYGAFFFNDQQVPDTSVAHGFKVSYGLKF